jgi:hypothetical protein
MQKLCRGNANLPIGAAQSPIGRLAFPGFNAYDGADGMTPLLDSSATPSL